MMHLFCVLNLYSYKYNSFSMNFTLESEDTLSRTGQTMTQKCFHANATKHLSIKIDISNVANDLKTSSRLKMFVQALHDWNNVYNVFTSPPILSNFDKDLMIQDYGMFQCVQLLLPREFFLRLLRPSCRLSCEECLAFVGFWRECDVAIIWFGFHVLSSLRSPLWI